MMIGPTVAAAAAAAGIGERTAYRYMCDPAVKAALSEALDIALTGATVRTVTAMGAALDTLEAVHRDPDLSAGARVSAARAIIDGGPKLREGFDLAERVSELERRLTDGK